MLPSNRAKGGEGRGGGGGGEGGGGGGGGGEGGSIIFMYSNTARRCKMGVLRSGTSLSHFTLYFNMFSLY